MCDVYGEAWFKKINVYNLTKLFQEGLNSIQDKDRSGEHTWNGDFNDCTHLVHRRLTIVDIPEQLGISVATTDKNVPNDCLF